MLPLLVGTGGPSTSWGLRSRKHGFTGTQGLRRGLGVQRERESQELVWEQDGGGAVGGGGGSRGPGPCSSSALGGDMSSLWLGGHVEPLAGGTHGARAAPARYHQVLWLWCDSSALMKGV